MATRITDRTIRNLKPEPGKRLEIGDIVVTGLRVRAAWARNVVRRVWYFRYRYRGSGALVPMRLGEYPATQLREARDIALNHRKQLDQGMDPRDVERARRAISQSSKAYSVAMLADDFLTYAQRNKAPKTFRDYRRYLEIVKARWGDRNAAEIRRGDVIDLLDRQSEKGYRSAGHLLSASRAAWSYAIEREKIEMTPWAGLKRQTRAYKARTKDRALSDAELREMLLALPDSGIPKPSQLVLHLILWTGCRPGEVCGGEWREIDLSESIWQFVHPA